MRMACMNSATSWLAGWLMRLAGGAAADRGLPRALSEQLHHVGNSNANMVLTWGWPFSD